MADLLTNAFIRIRLRLKRIYGRMLSDYDAAEDVLQDVFVRLWKKQYPLQSEKEAEVLISRAARNASLNERRKKRKVPLDADYPDDSPDIADRERAFDEMKRKINTELTDKQRYIFEEREYGGRAIKEIAEELNMEASAVRMQLSRARKTLRNALKDDR